MIIVSSDRNIILVIRGINVDCFYHTCRILVNGYEFVSLALTPSPSNIHLKKEKYI